MDANGLGFGGFLTLNRYTFESMRGLLAAGTGPPGQYDHLVPTSEPAGLNGILRRWRTHGPWQFRRIKGGVRPSPFFGEGQSGGKAGPRPIDPHLYPSPCRGGELRGISMVGSRWVGPRPPTTAPYDNAKPFGHCSSKGSYPKTSKGEGRQRLPAES